jgi:HK97 family phage prohead protease/HK97 family phage major capsid protein
MEEQKNEILKRTAELRAGKKPMTLEGYAALYDEETVVGGQRERIERGAFEGRLDDDVRLLFNHDNNMPFARTTNGTLKLSLDENGLYYKADVIDTQAGRDLYAMVKRGDVSQSSFAFNISERRFDEGVMVIEKVGQLYDVSPVTYPAYEATTVVARQKEENKTVETMRKYTLEDLQALRKQKSEEHQSFVAKLDESTEEISDNDMIVARNMVDELAKLDKKIELKRQEADAAARLARVSNVSSQSEQREVNKVNSKFSLQRAITSIAEGRHLTGAELEWAQEYSREAALAGISSNGNIGIPGVALRAGSADDFQATGGGDGSGFVATEVGNAIEALRAPAMIQQVGTTVINNATGNLQFPRVSVKAIATAEGEVDASASSTMEMDTVTLSPLRVANKTTYSKLLLIQGGPDVDAVIARDLIGGVNTLIDQTAFATVNAALTATSTTELTADNAADAIFALEAAVADAGTDMSNLSLVASTDDAHKFLRQAPAVASITTLLGEYRYFATPHIKESGKEVAILGNWGQAAMIAFFGGIDLLVDPYSAAGTGQINLHVNRFYGFGIRQAAALAMHEATAT